MLPIENSYEHPLFGIIRKPKLPPTSPAILALATKQITHLNAYLIKHNHPLDEGQIAFITESSKFGLNTKNLETLLSEICTRSLYPEQKEFLAQIEIGDWSTESRQIAILNHVLEKLKLDSIHLIEAEVQSLRSFIRAMTPPSTSKELDAAYVEITEQAKQLVKSDCTTYKEDIEDYYLVTSADV